MNRELRFDELVAEATDCQRCERMQERKAVIGPLNGTIHPRLLMIAEAPGRNGADRTRRPFDGDSSGANFEQLLAAIGLRREEIFITNTVLCSPRKASGANDKPTRREISNCSNFLARQIELLDPPVIATLGAVALDALKAITPHQLKLRDDAATINYWHERLLVPLYHPSPQVIITVRNLDQQKRDYRVLLEALLK